MISSPLQSTLKVASGAVLVASEILEHCTKSVLQRAATSVPQGPTPNPVPETDKQPQPLTRPQFPDVFGENDLQKLRGSSSSDPLIEHRVPASPVERILQFGGLSMSLAMGAVSEAARRIVSPLSPETKPAQGSPFLTTANAERLTAGLCRMRGAALKLGQMLSIQDESLVPPDFQKILDRVRSSANMMPRNQLLSVLREDLGEDWESKLGSFDFSPIAAASIGQVHRATLKTGEQVVMKVQYPGVATSIKSDLLNVKRILQYTNVFPKGLYMDQLLKVAHDELSRECDYTIEAANQKRFKELLIQDHDFHVPKVYDELSSKRILTSEFVNGVELDHVKTMSLERRNAVAERLLRLCLHELFKFHFMQTDPNWANFLYNPHLDVVYLLDFGSCSQYDEDFIRHYLSMVWACANMDREAIINHSIALGFLTGQESKVMLDAHVESAFVVGEPFRTETYNFAMSSVPARLSSLAAVMVEHRLTPPPIEAYALHRKLSGFYLACIKLGAQIACRNSLETIVQEYGIDDVKSTAFCQKLISFKPPQITLLLLLLLLQSSQNPTKTMKKLYRKGTVHPSPSPSPSLPVSEELSLSYLPAAILTLAAALSTEDKQVLAYLLSCSAASTTATASSDFSDDHHHHEASPKCYCFSCYSSFWARWDSSPNHQLIHDIIDALEDESFSQGKKKQSVSKRDRKKNNKGLEINANDRIVRNNDGSNGSGRVIPESGQNGDPKEVDGGQFEETGDKQGSVRKIVSFIGQRLWGTVWG